MKGHKQKNRRVVDVILKERFYYVFGDVAFEYMAENCSIIEYDTILN